MAHSVLSHTECWWTRKAGYSTLPGHYPTKWNMSRLPISLPSAPLCSFPRTALLYKCVCVWIIRHHDECATTKGNQAGAARLMGSSVTGIYLHKSTCNTQVRPFVIDRGGKKLRGRRKETGEREITSQTSHQVHWILIYKAIISACFV